MPIYEYKCETCETKFEKLVRSSDNRNELSCPACGERHLSQEYSTFSARANGASSEPAAPSCGAGMCQRPGMCGMN